MGSGGTCCFYAREELMRLLLQRVLYTLPVIWLVVSLVFLLIHLVPGDPIQQMLGEGAPPADIDATRHAYGLDAPLGEQYIHYWKGVLHGDLGPSFRYNQSVTRLLAQRYPYTLNRAGLTVRGDYPFYSCRGALRPAP